jgi:hypothetical protein
MLFQVIRRDIARTYPEHEFFKVTKPNQTKPNQTKTTEKCTRREKALHMFINNSKLGEGMRGFEPPSGFCLRQKCIVFFLVR